MITIPICLKFDYSNIIGSITIDETKLPSTPNFCFTIGYLVKNISFDGNITDYALNIASVTSDSDYLKYLESEKARNESSNNLPG